MDRKVFAGRAREEILIIDGALGTMLQPHLAAGGCIDAMNIDKPDIVAGVHLGYLKAGADIITTNTFGATRIKLSEFGLAHKTGEINRSGVRLARGSVGDRAWVAGSIGPTGKLIEPLGELCFAEAYEAFREQVVTLAEAGVDLFLLETFSDLKEAKIACMAVKENSDLPLMVSMTFGDEFVTFTGTDPETAAVVLTSLGADAVGVNCSTGPGPMLEVLGRLVVATGLPVFVEPNAGIPRLSRGKKFEYLTSPQEMAEYGEKFVEIGANIIGTCCGSTTAHTALLSERFKRRTPLTRATPPRLSVASRYRTLHIGFDLPFCIIGERINPTNRPELSDELRASKIGLAQDEARAQEQEGAQAIDVNVGVPGIDEAEVMSKAVRGVETVTRLPLSIDSVNPLAVEAALRETAGKPLINSITGEGRSIEVIPPLAVRYGAALLCLAVGEHGIPETAEERLHVLKGIVDRAERAGVKRENLICDCLTLTVSAQQKRAEETLSAIRLVKAELGMPTVLGISNISYGLPDRSLINSTFLSMAMAAGLDAAIMNPGDGRIMETVRAGSVLTLRDKDSRDYVRSHVKKRKKVECAEPTADSSRDAIYRAVLSGNKYDIAALVEHALKSGKTAGDINAQLLIPAIDEVGFKYEHKELYLPQMIMAAETFEMAFKVLAPYFESSDVRSKGTVIICTVKGDVHDIGKNIVALMLRNHGFKVVDLGKNVPGEVILDRALETGAGIVGLSALMTTTMAEMPAVIELLRKHGAPAKIIVGGAVVSPRFARDIGADAYAKDGIAAVTAVHQLVEKA